MKKVVLTVMLAMFATVVNAQDNAISKYFEKYVDDPSFMHVNFSGKMFQMISQLEMDNPEEQKMVEESLGKIKRVQVLGKDSDVDGRKMYSEALSMIKGKGFDELMSVREEDKDIRFYIKEKNNKIDELFMVMGGDNEFGMLSIVGDGIDLNMLYKLSKKIGMDGFEELEFLDDKRGG
ncbi:DUF4252 domain-containing protein [Roseivirga pacifica]|uniref:DUF4252 domain-containing protein n=1 Tax=Roseivirga pacifica TaxID=1267423 RepID=UPI002094F2CE|nr:DUF4252 domain-containing protein [Roseivirga pacifica]MCO6357323.1 DUF4252 domain-containing protein [Roseivirga pacifica]MCO6367963.1 DUF4252 domain-containing protein [Roseivirga pacifica]MCO6369555.1 DUF4252 domain-containing protein [Roseivirga pacifica]MCO6373409.1 DUF4252 domain-containing protein [Roseivirga pacifica]MCO6377334.1 DUF4252 domain-containing protein [Roseivirga pacifica]